MAVVRLTEADDGKNVVLRVSRGDVAEVVVEEGGFVGYYWTVAQAPDQNVAAIEDLGQIERTGSLAKHAWRLTPVHAGTTTLVLARRPSGQLRLTVTVQA